MKTFLYRSIIGIFFGAFLALLIMYAVIYFGEKDVLDAGLFVKNTLGAIFCGWFFTVTPLFFENTNLKLSQQTALHFGSVVILYFTLAVGIGWIPFTLISALLNLGMFISFYLVIWTAFYLYFRKQAKKLNAELNEI